MILKLIPLLIVFFLSACQSNPFGVPGGVPGGTPGGSPLPSLPGGGSGGSPGEETSAPTSPTSAGGGSESDADSDAEATGEGAADGAENTAEASPSWEDETQQGGSESGEASDVTFEEAGEDEVSFEEPEFESDGGLTEAELEELEKELNESLGDFDEEIQREKTFAEERANDNTDNGPLGGVGVFETYEDKSARNAQASSGSANSASANAASDGSAAENAGTGTGNEATASQGIGTEVDEEQPVSVNIPEPLAAENIVARQLREAAESETDPELQKKLWEEYRKYQGQ